MVDLRDTADVETWVSPLPKLMMCNFIRECFCCYHHDGHSKTISALKARTYKEKYILG